MTTFDEFYASLDPDVGIRGKQFEKFVKWFLKTDPTWASQVDEVWLWKDYPNRWGADCGIDLIFTQKNGKTWAVQSKCVSPNHDIKKKEIDSFLSESSDSRIDGRLLIASTDGIGKNAFQVIKRQEKQVVCFLLEQFRQSEINFPSSIEDLNKGKRKEKKQPKQHQIEAINAVYRGLQNENKGQVLMACGTGKTLTSLWIKEKLKAEQVLVLVPSLSLLSQTLKEWNSEALESFKWICVCSDKSVAKDKDDDQWISNSSEIGVPVTSEVIEIKNFLDESGSKVVFSTYQSSSLIVEAQEYLDTTDFDLVIADEAHRCSGRVSPAFSSVLDEKKIKASKRLFFTATPRILSSRLKKNALEKEIEVVSMDDYSVFGKILHQIKFSEAIDKNLLSDYQVIVVGVDDEMIKKQIINRDLLEISSNGLKTDAENLAAHIALAKTIEEYGLARVITFHGLVKGAKNFAEDHLKVFDWINNSSKVDKKISASHVSGNMNSGERNKKINQLKNVKEGEIGILTNARCLSEGVDVPTLDGIAFIDPKQSQVDIIQAVGRAIRKSENKNFGKIVIPVYISEISQNIDDQVFSSKFASVWKIILALKSQDDYLMDEIDSLRISLGQRGSGNGSGRGIQKIVLDLPMKINKKFVDNFQTILIKNTSDDWLEKYGELKLYYDKFGNSDVPQGHPSLGDWVSSQRGIYNSGNLIKERTELLEILDFVWDAFEARWNEKFLQIKEFESIHGHTNPEEISLKNWARTQRNDYKKNKLSQIRIKKLNDIGFVWDPLEEEWNQKFKQLKTYKLQNEVFPQSRENKSLGAFMGHQRLFYKKGKLSKERIDLLNSIGFLWDPLEEEWQNNFLELKHFLKQNDNSYPNKRDSSLGTWVIAQRIRKKNNKLSKERIELLDSLNFIWDINEFEWDNNFQNLKDNLNSYTEDPSLSKWVSHLRSNYKKRQLSEEKIERLNNIGFIWDPFESKWNEKFIQLRDFYEENKKNKEPENKSQLGKWVVRQRKHFKDNKLTEKQIKLLDSLNFVWDPFETKWNSSFFSLKEFFNKNGHTLVNVNEGSLGSWVLKQRRLRRSNKLSEERIKLLNDLNFVWEISKN